MGRRRREPDDGEPVEPPADLSGPRALRASLLPRGTRRRSAARVGVQVAKDARAYGHTLKQLWELAQDPSGETAYLAWLRGHCASADELERQRVRTATAPIPVSVRIIVDAERISGSADRSRAVAATIASLRAQTHERWHAAVAASHPSPTDLDRREPRISVVPDAATALASTAPDELVVFAEAGDLYEPDALFHLAARVWDDPSIQVLTWDDDVLSVDGGFGDPRFRAAWSEHALLSEDAVGRAVAVRADLLAAVPGGPPTAGLGDARWWDFVLRLDPPGDRARHVPRVLSHLHRRPAPRPDAATVFIRQHLERNGRTASVEVDGAAVRVRWTMVTPPVASILIPTRHNRELLGPCLASLARTEYPDFEVVVIDNGDRTEANEVWYAEQRERHGLDLRVEWWTEPFNYSAVNNAAARLARGEVFVFLNDDTEVLDHQWLTEMVSWAVQPQVGVVGAHLIAPDGTLQHAGVVVGLNGFADHVFEGLAPSATTLFGPTRAYRDFLAVTCACAAISRERFEHLGGFDERFVLCGSDVKLGLDSALSGWRNVCTPFVKVAHKESATRGTAVPERDFFTSWWPYQRWLRAGDPHYSPNLSLRSRAPALRPTDEPSPLERVGDIIGRPLAPKRGATQWDDEAHARWLVERCTIDDATVDEVRTLHRDHAAAGPPRTIAWWMPDLESPFYGGINTTLRLADHLRRAHGVVSSFVIAADPNEWYVRSAIAAAYPALGEASITFIDDPALVHHAPAVDLAVATLWETAYLVARAPGATRKAYLIQDYEPVFYPAGTRSALAEESYRLGLYGICNTERLLDLYRDRFAGGGTSFWPAVDRAHLNAEGRRPVDHDDPAAAGADGEPLTIFVYARPGHARNCWELASAALTEVKARLGTGVRIVTAGSWATPDDLGGGIEHLGFLEAREYRDLYRRCDLGLTLQVSEHPSYLPLELMACGVPVVAFDHPAADWLLRHEQNSLRCRRTKDGLVDALMRMATDPALRARLGARGEADITARFGDWDRAFAGVYAFLGDPEGGAS